MSEEPDKEVLDMLCEVLRYATGSGLGQQVTSRGSATLASAMQLLERHGRLKITRRAPADYFGWLEGEWPPT